jgi:hypothetical protein
MLQVIATQKILLLPSSIMDFAAHWVSSHVMNRLTKAALVEHVHSGKWNGEWRICRSRVFRRKAERSLGRGRDEKRVQETAEGRKEAGQGHAHEKR